MHVLSHLPTTAARCTRLSLASQSVTISTEKFPGELMSLLTAPGSQDRWGHAQAPVIFRRNAAPVAAMADYC